MPRMIAKKPFRYAGRMLQPGDEFEVKKQFRAPLKFKKQADDAPAAASSAKPAQRGGLESTAAAVPLESTDDAGLEAAPKRKYKRRDMVAESE